MYSVVFEAAAAAIQEAYEELSDVEIIAINDMLESDDPNELFWT
jgi:hypothetical protein